MKKKRVFLLFSLAIILVSGKGYGQSQDGASAKEHGVSSTPNQQCILPSSLEKRVESATLLPQPILLASNDTTDRKLQRNPFGKSSTDGMKPGSFNRVLSAIQLYGIVRVGNQALVLISLAEGDENESRGKTAGFNENHVQHLHQGECLHLMIDGKEQILTLSTLNFRSVILLDEYKHEYTIWL